MVFPRMCCKSCFFPECAISHVFFPECDANHIFFQNVLPIMFFPTILGKKHDLQHILGKTMISSTFWRKKHDWQHILGKNMIDSTSWVKTLLRANYWGKISLIAHSGKNQDCQVIFGKTYLK
jgi:hypothetical protein